MIDNCEISPETIVKHLANKVIEVIPLLVGGSTKIAFLNAHGAPYKSKN